MFGFCPQTIWSQREFHSSQNKGAVSSLNGEFQAEAQEVFTQSNHVLCDSVSADSISAMQNGDCTFVFTAVNAQNVYKYIWFFGDGLLYSDQMAPTHS